MSDEYTRMSERSAARNAAKAASRWAQAEAMNVIYNDPPEPGEAEVRANLPARVDDRHCAHGRLIGDMSHFEGMVFACGWAHCVCCEQDFPYVGSAGGSFGGGTGSSSHSSSPDQHLCFDCGGITRHEVHGIPGDTLISSGGQPGVMTPPDAECCGWTEHEPVDYEGQPFDTNDPRKSYEQVKVCSRCQHVLSWRLVWFADLS